MFKKEVEKATDQISSNLRSSSLAYYKIGINAFLESREKSWIDFQPAIGNLAISIELILKAIIAQKAIKMLYPNLPGEAQLLLCYPESLTEKHNAKSFLNDLKSFSYKSIEIDKAITLFYHFYPDLKQEFHHFFSSLSTVRNISVHASLPDFQKYELERIAYYSTKLLLTINSLEIFQYFSFRSDRKVENFLTFYKDELIKKVKKSLEEAQRAVKSKDLKPVEYEVESWKDINQTCPICGLNGVSRGTTEENSDEDGIYLTFFCEEFSCNSCGLVLDDYEEMELAGMETSVDRESDIDQWIGERELYDYDARW